MEIKVDKRTNEILISKSARIELKKLKLKFLCLYFIFSLLNIYFSVNKNIKFFIVSFIFIGIALAIPIKGLYDQLKYLYSEEILEINNELLTIKYKLEDEILFIKEIKTSEISTIFYKVDKRLSYFRAPTKKNKNIILSKYFEDIRSLKIKTYDNKTYSWGINIKDKEIKNICDLINSFIFNR
ncbi:hypothetical protein HUW86_04890 [Fusobacterium sp. SB021]|uniref:cytochrome c oxidase VIIc family protein n=1 Tax=Fusobacterium sp. SB021 TaxID=2744227 RepID=UPI003CF36993